MKILATPKKQIRENAQFYGDAYGMTAIVDLVPGQKWNAAKSGGYWHVTKRGAGIELRLTDAAMWRLFEETEG
jgi:hypothetical protein